MKSGMKQGKTSTLGPADQSPLPLLDADRQEVQKLYDAIRRGNAKLVGPNGEARRLPDSLYSFLVEVIGLLQEGKSIYIIQNQAKLTTIEAAAMLGVSRQFLVHLLDKNEMPYHMVGTHRRIYVKDLARYKAQRDSARKRLLDDLSKAEASEGIYGAAPPSDGN
jgi:excisionase family DNA binding protein